MNVKTTFAFVLALTCAWGASTDRVEAGRPFPLYQAVVTDISGKVFFEATSKGKTTVRDAVSNEPWLAGETLRVKKEKSSWAKAVVSELAMLRLSPGASVTLQGRSDDGSTPPDFVLNHGAMFLRTRNSGDELIKIKAGAFSLETKSAFLYVALGKKLKVMVHDGGVTVAGSSHRYTIGRGKGFIGRAGRGKRATLPQKNRVRMAAAFDSYFPVDDVPTLKDTVAPQVTILSPKDNMSIDTGEVEVNGLVDDPSVTKIKVSVAGKFCRIEDVEAGQFTCRIKLFDRKNVISVSAEDDAGNEKQASVVVLCKNPLKRPEGPPPDKPKPALQRALDKIKEQIANPSNPFIFIGLVLAAGLLLFIGYLIIRKFLKASKRSLQKASELATGIVFQKCEKCQNREYHYHLFYTTETVNSPFLRNLINNVNPMATSMMNESLESLLSTGLKWSHKAKSAENKIRVICSWCDFCRTGTLSLEHMQGEAVVKVDDYQIIHPIFIEWVRKVYD